MQRLFILLFLLMLCVPAYAQDEEETIPDAMPLVDEGEQDISNILLIGAATEYDSNPGLTDTLMIVSVNRDTRHIAAVSIPRDLYVYIPEYGMHKINQAHTCDRGSRVTRRSQSRAGGKTPTGPPGNQLVRCSTRANLRGIDRWARTSIPTHRTQSHSKHMASK